MIELHTGQSGEKIIVTLTELATLSSPHYLFVFKHVLTKQVVAFVAGADESTFPYRYNQFDIDTAVLFLDKPSGEWHYTAYEQVSNSNINPSLALQPALEYGKMILYAETEFEYDMYDQPVTYKAYGS
jgi:hypothetical protein